MAEKKYLTDEIEIPSGVKVSVDSNGFVKAVGPKGEASKQLLNPGIKVSVEGNEIKLMASGDTLKYKKMINTFSAHAANLIKGVTEGFVYKLKICSGHFPMTVALKGSELSVKNEFGEKVPRVLRIKEGAKVTIAGEIIEVSGTNIETVGQVSADIELLTRRVDYDRRIFQDGIYIIDKNGKPI